MIESEFVLVYEKYKGMVLSYFLKNKRSDYEDLAQETWKRVWASRKQFEGRNNCHISTWVGAIAKNALRDTIRKESARIRIRDSNELLSTPTVNSGVEHAIYTEQLLNSLKPAIARLLLKYAHNGNVSKHSSDRVRVVRARKRLRDKIRKNNKWHQIRLILAATMIASQASRA